ncbi:hypothetical protein DS745_03545 [Anaerobacillus alkaliphilus]|uniref:DUF4181 domain-containing protein n=1 Tax=Anaerobacillus alkaliphilus TaxID=1548597 RepID=A0A4Q0W1J9_9BACI|nr:hypothetical protein [Anaerobacillus alkaliphilus]RXJ04471.1 hypothetical protein DS745_03545 [Anaerobacillus alkaliphilus]
MKISTLLYLIIFLLSIGFYNQALEPVIGDRSLKIFSFIVILYILDFVKKKLEIRFEFLTKRLDKQLSVWIVIGVIFTFIIIYMFQ